MKKEEAVRENTAKLEKDKKWLTERIEDKINREFIPGKPLEFKLESSKANYPVFEQVIGEVISDFTKDGWNIELNRGMDQYVINVKLS